MEPSGGSVSSDYSLGSSVSGAGGSSFSVLFQGLASVEWESFTHELKQAHVLVLDRKLEFRLEKSGGADG